MSVQSFDTFAMNRGRDLEEQVLQRVAKFLKVGIQKCGLF